jgi:hypothetical protein
MMSYSQIKQGKNIETRQIGTNSTNKEGYKYIKHVNDQFNNHRIHEKVQKLYKEVMSGSFPDDKTGMIDLNKLDKTITNIMLSAEKKCCKKKEQALWTPQLHQSNLVIQHWNLVSKSIHQGINIDNRLSHVQAKMTSDTQSKINITDKSAKYSLIQALMEHEQILKLNGILRGKYLEKIIEDLDGRDKTTTRH